jgi:hypothetical protein
VRCRVGWREREGERESRSGQSSAAAAVAASVVSRDQYSLPPLPWS